MNFVKIALENGGQIKPLLIPCQDLNGPSLTNPSILVHNNKILVNLRNINYTLYHSEKKKYEHIWGPLVYIHPENELKLKTTNVICELDTDLNIINHYVVDTSRFDKTPLWDFVGLEDARLINWDSKLFLTGVRRDTTTNGQGRMELSEIVFDNNSVTEISRTRIPMPGVDEGDKTSYCEKNWMPFLDLPYHYIKWSNPTHVVKYDYVNSKTEDIYLGTEKLNHKDWRGGSQVVSWKGGYIALIHETNLLRSEAGRKDAVYRHRFLVWDKNWNLIKYSKEFSFIEASIEFSVGMDLHNGDFLITFGYQDNAAYVLKVSESVVENFINEY